MLHTDEAGRGPSPWRWHVTREQCHRVGMSSAAVGDVMVDRSVPHGAVAMRGRIADCAARPCRLQCEATDSAARPRGAGLQGMPGAARCGGGACAARARAAHGDSVLAPRGCYWSVAAPCGSRVQLEAPADTRRGLSSRPPGPPSCNRGTQRSRLAQASRSFAPWQSTTTRACDALLARLPHIAHRTFTRCSRINVI